MACDAILCPPTLPISHVVGVTIEDNTLEFNNNCMTGAMLFTPDAGVTLDDQGATIPYLTTTNRVRQVSTQAEAATHWPTDTETGRAIQTFFQQTKRPPVLKVGFWDLTIGSESVVEAAEAIVVCDDCWYGIGLIHQFGATVFKASAHVDILAEWGQANGKMGFYDDSDKVNNENPDDALSLKYRLGNAGLKHSVVIYQEEYCIELPDPANPGQTIDVNRSDYGSMWAMAYVTGVDFGNPGSAYTLKFNGLHDPIGIRPQRVTSDIAFSVTGYIPQQGLDPSKIGYGNMYTSVDNRNTFLEGVTVTGHFIDVVHSIDYISREFQQRVFQRLRLGPGPGFSDVGAKIPITERGLVIIDEDLQIFAGELVDAGIISDDDDPEYSFTLAQGDSQTDTEFVGAYRITRPPVISMTYADRSQRQVNGYRFCFKLAGAVHGVSGTICAYV